MKKLIDLDNWNRKEHFLFFSKFDEPFFCVTVKVDCTIAYQKAKEKGVISSVLDKKIADKTWYEELKP